MSNIAILNPCIVGGDAVSNDVIGMHQVLTKYGYKVQIFAADWCLSKPLIKHINDIEHFLSKNSDILIYHYSIGWEFGINLLQQLQCKKVIKYHSVTPPEFYEGINREYESICREGQDQLKYIVEANCNLYLSDSEFNTQELYSKGVCKTNSLVIPPFNHIDRLLDIEADFAVLDKYQDGKINILMVGRLAPNKGHLALIDSFNIYHSIYNRESRLFIVGKKDKRLLNYTKLLDDKVKSLGLQEAVVFTEEVSDEALKAYYLVSNVFMITSEHEGFCVPLVEAMAMKLPIVAYSSCATPYTVGKIGFVWEQLNPYLLASSVDYITRNEVINSSLCEMGWHRYKKEFANEQIETRFIEIIKSLL